MSIPPADLFQLPWEQGDAWVSLDGIDNGFKRGPRSPHLYSNGGAVDFAPRKDMVQGEDTSNYWVTAAAAGTVIQISSCHLIISHPGGWNTEYQFLANIQVSMGEAVYRNQNLGIIASGTASQPFCSPVTHDIPHLHFSIRPNMEMVSFAGWEVNYNSLFNQTTFTKNGQKAYQYDPLLNIPALQINNLGDITWDITYTGSLDQYRYEKWHFVLTDLTSFSITTTPATDGLLPMIILFDANGNEITRGTEFLTSTQPAGDYFIQIQPEEGQGFYNLLLEEMTEDDKAISVLGAENVKVGESAVINVYFKKVPPEGYKSAEVTCSYDGSLLNSSNIITKNLFGENPATAISGPQNGSFIYAIAGSHGQKSVENGALFSFDVVGLNIGQTTIICSGNISLGDGTLTDIGTDSLLLDILEGTPIPTPTLPPNPEDIQIMGQVFASKTVRLSLYDTENLLVTSTSAQADGTFTLSAPAGEYIITAEAEGFIDAHGNIVITSGNMHTMQNISLLAGDIDNNNEINQLDAMSIAINYNTASPTVADLNSDGIINLLDLEILSTNYRYSGFLNWE
ncbi:MAG: peptidoglycan DD-metalloendopeptidase family protein [Anaerolineae bacterium]|nr:peptidoglycan DD-metalloendopeptidase family protein [Anaerolineae bacterium]MBT7782965.1 peptidoglycan DD-metalloendopeptidase family protein [Anaerolineae bacterium]